MAIDYDAHGQVIKETVQPGEAQYQLVTDYERTVNPHGAVTKRTVTWVDPLDGLTKTRIESTVYDTRSRYAISQTNAKNHTETRNNSESTGALLSLTGPNQLTTSWQYDGWGRVLREDRADGTATTTAYRACIDTCTGGAVSVRITQNWFGSSQTTVPTEEFADTLGRAIRTRSWGFDGSAILAEKVYDANGRVEKIARPRYSSAAAVWTLYDTRDPIGRVTQIRSPSQTGSGYDTTSFGYNGLILTTSNAKSQNRTELRNAIGKLKSVTDHDGKTTSYLYEAFGNLTRTIDPKGNQINIGYDKLGRKLTLTDPDLGHWTYTVDPIGQTRRQSDAKAQLTTFEFDELARMTRRLEPDLDSRWDYDTATKGVGKLAEAYTMVTGVKDYRRIHSYDSLGRPNSVLTRLDWDYSEITSYDGFARVQTTTHQRNAQGGSGGPLESHTLSYNAQGRVYLLQRSDGSTTSTVWQGLVQDAEGRFTSEQLGNGLATARVYNPYTGRLASIQTGASGSHQNDSYTYDAIGNLATRSQLISTSGALLAESFAYDNLNRLQTSTIGAATQTTAYDDIGNITSKTGVGSYVYPPQGAGSVRPHAVSGITGSVAGLSNPGFNYDANGNLTSGLARAYGWTSYNLPEHIDKLSGATAVQRTAFLYGPEHQRTRQTVSPMSGGTPGAPTTTIWYAGSVEKEIDGAAGTTTIRTHMPMGLGFVQETISGTAVAATASATREPRYLLKDHLGSTIAITDPAQAVLQRLSYDAWGRRRSTDGTDDAGALWGTLKNNQDHSGYTGHEHLDQLALVHMNARMYDPLIGRHTSADPTVPDPEDTQALNRYSYVLNNGLAFVDPTGLGAHDPPKETMDNRPTAIGVRCSIAPRCDGVVEYPDQSAVGEKQAKTESAAGSQAATDSGSVFDRPNRQQAWDKGGCASPTVACAQQNANWQQEYTRREKEQRLDDLGSDTLLLIFGGKAAQAVVEGVSRLFASTVAAMGVPTEGLAFELKHLAKHIEGTPAANRVARNEGAAHVFESRAALAAAERVILERGQFTGSVRGWDRYGVRFDSPIGYRIGADGSRTPLYYGEIKVRDSMYHVTPRTGPSR